MKYKRRLLLWKALSVILLFCQLLFYMPAHTPAAAGSMGENFVAPETASGIIKNKGFRLSTYYYYDDGSLNIRNQYHYTPGHVITYYTTDVIWSKVHSKDAGHDGYPTKSGVYGADWVYSGVSANNERVEEFSTVSFSNFTYSQEQIRNMLTRLFGELQVETEYTIYMSPIYVLRERFADGTYKQDNSVKYYNLDDIRRAASWSMQTRLQFPAYYDIPMTFVMRGGQIRVVPIDMDKGNATISDASYDLSYVFGDKVKVVPTPQLEVDGETLSYAERWNFGYSIPTLNETGYPTEFELTKDIVGRRVYLGYSRGGLTDKGIINVIPVDEGNGNAPIPGKDFTINFEPGIEVEVPIHAHYIVDGVRLSHTGNYSIDNLSLSMTKKPIKVTFSDFDDEHTVYIGYKSSGVTPPVTPPITPPVTPPVTPPITPPVTPPVTPPITPPVTPSPSDFHAIIRKEGQQVQVYADDYNSSTGALDDLQPYLVQGVGSSQAGIPSTEQVAIRAKAPGWEYDIKINEVADKMESSRNISITVGITLWTYTAPVPNPAYPSDDDEDAERNAAGEPIDEHGNVIPEEIGGGWSSTYAEYLYTRTIKEEKNYSYWQVEYADVYKADKVVVGNTAFENAQELTVDWSVAGAPTVPTAVITSSHEVKVKPMTAYAGSPIYLTYYNSIDWDAVSSSVTTAANGYKNQIPELLVKSDKLVIDGETILDNTQKEKNACEPSTGAVANVKSKIKDTIYPQTYKSGVDLKNTTPNAYYVTNAQYTYSKVGSSGTKVPPASEMSVNNVIVHTPIVCDGIVTVDGEEQGRHDNGDFYRGITVDFPLKDVYNPFTIEISNYGTHRLIAGYGERDFEDAKSGDKNIAVNSSGTIINEVKFPFGVYYDMNSDSFDADGNLVSYADDRYFAAGTWICVGDDTPQFYVMGSLTPGEYSVDFRSISTNCPKDASGNYITSGNTQNNANKTESKYVATDLIKLNVYEDFMAFELNGTNDPVALENFKNGQRMLTLDRGYYFNFFSETVGDRFNSNTMELLITPSYSFISEDGKVRTVADLYYHENIKGKSEYYVKVGNVKDGTNVHTYTNLDDLPGIDKELLKHTESVLGSKISGNKTDMFVFGDYIKSDRWFRMHPPITDPMPNKYCPQCYMVFSETESRPCSHGSSPVTIFTMASVEDLVQDWYAGFYLPADTYCITSDTKQGFCDSCGTMRYVTQGRTTCPEHGTALKVAAGGANGVTPFSFNTYAAEHTITGEEEFFRKDGYVAINFDIMAIDSAGSFVRQYEDYDTTEIAKQWKESKFPYQTGDVVLYRLDKSIRDAYEIGGSE